MSPLRTVLLAIAFAVLAAAPAGAAEFVVNSTEEGTDFSPGDGTCNTNSTIPVVCTLRAAVQQANVTGGAADTITVPAGTYILENVGSMEDAAAQGDLDVTNPVIINGAGARSTIVRQDAPDRVFQVSGAGNATFTGITITGGEQSFNDGGAGIANFTSATVRDSVVRGNSTLMYPGGGIDNSGTLTVERSLITGNSTQNSSGGGGIYNSSGTVLVRNSTISDNTAPTAGAYRDDATGPNSVFEYVTVTGNTSTGGGGAVVRGAGGSTQVHDSIFASNKGPDCSGTGYSSLGHNIESGISCGFTNANAGDRQNTDPQLGPLADNGGPSDSHLPAVTSPAVDNANIPGCPATDQRGTGFERPFGAGCDIGAIEARQSLPPPPAAPAPTSLVLDPAAADRTPGDANVVTATVRNNDGTVGADRSVRYAIAGPNEGAGAIVTGPAGTGSITWEGVQEGTDTLTAYVDTNGNLTPEPGEPTATATVKWALPAPVQGRTVNIEPVSGIVRLRTVRRGKVGAAGSTSVNGVLTEARQIPLDTIVDTRRGRAKLTSLANSRGATQNAQFYGGVFSTVQSRRGTRPVTEVRLRETLNCTSGTGRGKVTASRARSRRLWGNGRGRFRTRGRRSTATVRGTVWLQKDSCTATTTVVREGVVIVKDFAKRKNVRIRAGRRYIARRASRR